ncbi:MAG: DUF4135 domain-containing protein [Chlamydiia bacterium]|nr:DUF4135 domain-containing protein [Chlamydiia bacterium]
MSEINDAINSASSGAREVVASNAEGIAATLVDKTAELSSSLFEMGKEVLFDHPVVSLMTGVAIALTTAFLYYNREIPMPSISGAESKISQTLQQDVEGSYELAKGYAEGYVQGLLRSSQFKAAVGKSTINPKFADHLVTKIFNVCGRNISSEAKQQIIGNIVRDAMSSMENANRRINTCIQSGELEPFGIGRDVAVESVEPLGDESHHEGKIPLLIKFKGGKQIVYKPRSMLPERVLCGRGNSLFQEAGLGTYHVVCGQDGQGAFGFAEYLENRQSENTVQSKEELEAYLQRLCLLDKVGTLVGLSDLHYLNIITQGLEPYVIDGEVYLMPQGIPTGVMRPGDGPASAFDLSCGSDEKFKGKNKIWFHPKMKVGNTFKHMMSPEFLQSEVGVNLDKIHSETKVPPAAFERAKTAREELQTENSRIVLATTKDLNDIILGIDPLEPNTANEMIKLIQSEVEMKDFIFVESSVPLIREQILRDASHNDVPAFYLNHQRGEILYNGVVIGRRKTNK